MPSLDVTRRIQRYNAGREPERLALKYQAMRQGPFGFLRGSCHLFHEDWPGDPVLDRTPPAWITGDLHLENFGSYKGDNRLAYFDLNDFDEAVLAPVAVDLGRFLTSAMVAARSQQIRERDALALLRTFLEAYRLALGEGKARWVERQTATGMVQDLLEEARLLTRKRLLRIRTITTGRRHRLRLGKRALPVSPEQRDRVVRLITRFAARQAEPEYFRPIDIARRVAGTASLGLERYVILVEGKGGPDRRALLDLKQAVAPTFEPRSRQPAWSSESERVVSVQQWAQAVSPALLHSVRDGDRSFVLRELQPTETRLALKAWHRRLSRLHGVMVTMGQVVGWSHLRSGGRQGAAIADRWIEFAGESGWTRALVEFAVGYSRQVERDWREFTETLPAD